MAILIIEDEFLVAAEIRFHLEKSGFPDVQHAATEDEALAAIAARSWNAAILDANLNGVGVERIAGALNAKSIPFVVVTGYGRSGMPKSIGDDVPVISKPFRPGVLLNTVRQLCGGRSDTRDKVSDGAG